VGKVTLTAVTVGLQLGGQEFMEVVFFKDETAFDDFMRGNFEFEQTSGTTVVLPWSPRPRAGSCTRRRSAGRSSITRRSRASDEARAGARHDQIDRGRDGVAGRTDFWGVRIGIKNYGFFDIDKLTYVLEFGAGVW
jgi:hypothetical protein